MLWVHRVAETGIDRYKSRALVRLVWFFFEGLIRYRSGALCHGLREVAGGRTREASELRRAESRRGVADAEPLRAPGGQARKWRCHDV